MLREMRLAPGMLAVVLAGVAPGCSLELVDGDEAPPDPPPAPRCELGARYHMPQTDCGLQPPDSPPATCFWTIYVEAATIEYCWSDVCESVTYSCEGTTVTGRSEGRAFSGTVLPNGNFYWDGGGYLGGEYTPY
jgi:hypothetical protein